MVFHNTEERKGLTKTEVIYKKYILMMFHTTSYSYPLPSLLLRLTLILLVVMCKTTKAIVKMPPNFSVPAVFVFGDSIMDTGNNNNMTTPSRCNFPPYGKDFLGGIPTGRFGNGKVPSDLIGIVVAFFSLLLFT